MVLPSRYCSTTAGLTYDDRATAGVFPSFAPTARITPATTFFGLGFRLRETVLGERDRGDQRAAPGAEILGGEFVAHVLFDVVVQLRAGEIAERPVRKLVAEEAPPTRQLEQLAHRICEVLVDDRSAHQDAVLAAVLERDPAPAHGHVPLAERRDPERPRGSRVALGTDPKPAEIDQAKRQRADPFRRQRLAVHVLAHRLSAGPGGAPQNARACRTSPVPAAPEIRGGTGIGAGRLCRLPVAWSFAPARGEIQTSFHAGGMTSASMRATLSASVICFPRES